MRIHQKDSADYATRICRAQYTNMVGVLGRFGKHGRTTLYIEDVETFHLDEDIPQRFERREAPVRQIQSKTPAGEIGTRWLGGRV